MRCDPRFPHYSRAKSHNITTAVAVFLSDGCETPGFFTSCQLESSVSLMHCSSRALTWECILPRDCTSMQRLSTDIEARIRGGGKKKKKKRGGGEEVMEGYQ